MEMIHFLCTPALYLPLILTYVVGDGMELGRGSPLLDKGAHSRCGAQSLERCHFACHTHPCSQAPYWGMAALGSFL